MTLIISVVSPTTHCAPHTLHAKLDRLGNIVVVDTQQSIGQRGALDFLQDKDRLFECPPQRRFEIPPMLKPLSSEFPREFRVVDNVPRSFVVMPEGSAGNQQATVTQVAVECPQQLERIRHVLKHLEARDETDLRRRLFVLQIDEDGFSPRSANRHFANVRSGLEISQSVTSRPACAKSNPPEPTPDP